MVLCVNNQLILRWRHTASTTTYILLGNSILRTPSRTLRTLSLAETRKSLNVYTDSLRNSFTPTKHITGKCQHQISATVQAHLQIVAVPSEDQWNVFCLSLSQHRTTPEQAKAYLANHFRANAHITDLVRIDYLVDIGYELLHDAEWEYTQTGYLYKYFMSPKLILNDHGIDRFDEYRA